MREDTRTVIGLDLGDRRSHACVVERSSGQILERFAVPTTREGLRTRFQGRAPSLVVLEASGPSPWVSRELTALGNEVHVANTRRLALIAQSACKTDRNDAETLARLGRSELGLLGRPVLHRGAREQAHLEVIKARDVLVRCRTALINHVRGALKSLGCRPPRCTSEAFDHRVRDSVPAEVSEAIEPLLDQIGALTKRVRAFDRRVEALAKEEYPITELLRQVNGVGPLTSLAFVLVVGNARRFTRSRSVGPYLGLTPASQQSGERDPQLRISKAGNPYMRRLLVGCAQYILGPFGEDSALRRYGEALMQRGGKNAKRRAVVAVARKLAVLLHRLWVTGEVYEPLRSAREPLAPA
jgi:transposase